MKSRRIADVPDRISRDALASIPTKLLPQEAVLMVTRSGILAHTFPVALAGEPLVINQDLKAIVPSSGVDPSYLTWAIEANGDAILRSCSKAGTTVASIELEKLQRFEIPLPPVPEQRRIASALDAIDSKVDAAKFDLQGSRAKLAAYRAAVLRAACDGRLVPTEAELAQNDGRASDELRWAEMPLGTLGSLERGRSRHRPRDEPRLFGGPYPFIQTGDVRASGGRLRNFGQTYSEFGLQQSRLWPRGTLCITIAANIAETAILEFEACFPDSVVGFSHVEPTTVAFIQYVLQSERARLAADAPATAQKNINLETLRELPIRIPPLPEQRRIVAEVDRRLSVAERLESAIDANLARAKRLRQAILKRAFEGRLVPQDPNDEPAGVLLERIRQDNSKAPPNPKKRRTTVST